MIARVIVALAFVAVVTAITCPAAKTCVATDGDCSASPNLACTFPQGPSTGIAGMTTCKCATAPAGVTATLGGTCSASDRPSDSTFTCYQSKWYSEKTEGDRCVSNFDCNPNQLIALHCAAGLCVKPLAAGEVCYNSTLFTMTGSCPSTHYCVGDTPASAERTCRPRIVEDAACTTSSQCVPWASCDGGKCIVENTYFVPFDQAANSSSQCVGGLYDYTNRKCLNYDTIKANFDANLNGKVCDTDANCTTDAALHQGTADCQCNAPGGTSTCKWTGIPQATLVSTRATSIARLKALHANKCELQSPLSTPTTNQDLCSVRAGQASSSTLDACTLVKGLVAAGFLGDCGYVAAVCGAVHTMTVSLVSAIALMAVAFVGPKLA